MLQETPVDVEVKECRVQESSKIDMDGSVVTTGGTGM